MILAMPKKITLDSFAIMMQNEFKEIYKRFDGIDTRLDRIEVRLDKVEDRLDKVEKRLDGIEERLDNLEIRTARIEHSILIDHRDRIERLEERAFGK